MPFYICLEFRIKCITGFLSKGSDLFFCDLQIHAFHHLPINPNHPPLPLDMGGNSPQWLMHHEEDDIYYKYNLLLQI